MIKTRFAESLRLRRKQLDLTQEDLAEFSGVSVRYIQSLEAGACNATLPVLFSLAYALDTSPQLFVAPIWKEWLAAATDDPEIVLERRS